MSDGLQQDARTADDVVVVRRDGAVSSPASSWENLISSAGARVVPPVVAEEFVEGLLSASRPQKFRCDDGRLYAVKFQGNPYGDGRAIFTEHAVGLLGQLIGAPVAEVRRVRVTDELLALLRIDLNGQPATAGLHHGSRWEDGFSDRSALDYADKNRVEFGALHVLYSWLHCAGDHQFIYRNAEPHDVLSVDHSCFLPEGTGWTLQRLQERQDAVELDAFFGALSLGPDEYGTSLDLLNNVRREDIALASATIPMEWGVSMAEKAIFSEYVERRRRSLLNHFGRGTI